MSEAAAAASVSNTQYIKWHSIGNRLILRPQKSNGFEKCRFNAMRKVIQIAHFVSKSLWLKIDYSGDEFMSARLTNWLDFLACFFMGAMWWWLVVVAITITEFIHPITNIHSDDKQAFSFLNVVYSLCDGLLSRVSARRRIPGHTFLYISHSKSCTDTQNNVVVYHKLAEENAF